ncbi:MAG: AAA family ATPase [Bacteroidetes bacterium]|nr:AAA family ATPase [Bacteroidota bacterium]
MERLKVLSRQRIEQTDFQFKRYLYSEIDWSNRLIAIKGSRGVGKTTLILQYIREHFHKEETALYVSLDDLYFSDNSLIDLADSFYKTGGTVLFMDEVHKYPSWSQEIKNIYDGYPLLKIVFTSLSILQINKGYADLSRRVVAYNLQGLSFREFLEVTGVMTHSRIALEDVLVSHKDIESEVNQLIRPLLHFQKYLQYGYYPFFLENIGSYFQKLMATIILTLENDLPSAQAIDYSNIYKIRRLLYLIAHSVPFKPNISKLSEHIHTTRATVIQYLEHLKNAQIINLLNTNSTGTGYLTKPEKIYLQNTNIMYALAPETANTGNVRETFFFNQLENRHGLTFPKEGDFLVDNTYTFEIGGKNKTRKQIAGHPDSYIAMDDLEYGFENKIPLWLFGFLY